MGHKIIGSINVANFRDTKIVEMENSNGDVESHICIPIKTNGFLKRKTGLFCKLLISEIKNRINFNTHVIIATKHRANYKAKQQTDEDIRDNNVILGNGYAKLTPTNYDNIFANSYKPILHKLDLDDEVEVEI